MPFPHSESSNDDSPRPNTDPTPDDQHHTSSSSAGQAGDADFEPPSAAEDDFVFQAELARPDLPRRPLVRQRRRGLPLVLFLLTCFSTFIAGGCQWVPHYLFLISDYMPLRRTLISHWDTGLIYMACVLAILLTHEMGHFIATLIHRIPASFPYFLPLPISPIGTLGAVIGMDGLRANRKEMFDIGIAGPLAGLVVAVPILWVGIDRLDFTEPRYGLYQVDVPMSVRLALNWIRPPGYTPGQVVWQGQLNPYFMAGWVGLLITGLNMMPVSQLDGGHVTYTLFGKRAHWIARGFMLLAIAWVIYSETHGFIVMILLIMLVGTDHPPTSNDKVPLGWFRQTLGVASLSIPILCFAPRVIIMP